MPVEVAPILTKKETPPIMQAPVELNGKWKPPENDHTDTRALRGDKREEFILRYIGQVKLIAGRIIRSLPKNIRLEDLISEGVVGLLRAMNGYDPSKGVLFYSYSDFKIRGAILDYLRREDPLSRDSRENIKRGSEIREENENRVNTGLKPLTDEEMAEKLGIDIKKYREYSSLATFADSPNQLDKPFKKDGNRKDLVGKEIPRPDELAHKEEVNRILTEALEEFLSNMEPKKGDSEERKKKGGKE